MACCYCVSIDESDMVDHGNMNKFVIVLKILSKACVFTDIMTYWNVRMKHICKWNLIFTIAWFFGTAFACLGSVIYIIFYMFALRNKLYSPKARKF